MKRLLIVMAALMCFGSAVADNPKQVQRALEAHYKSISNSFKKKDSKSIFALMTDDYTITQPDGTALTKEQIKGSIEQQMNVIRDATWTRTITSLKLKGKEAVANVKGNFHGKIPGQDGQMHDFKLDAVTIDTWVKTPKGYLLQKSLVQKNTITVDGKPMQQPGG
jgi:ketosteroid isomerase-like protein